VAWTDEKDDSEERQNVGIGGYEMRPPPRVSILAQHVKGSNTTAMTLDIIKVIITIMKGKRKRRRGHPRLLDFKICFPNKKAGPAKRSLLQY